MCPTLICLYLKFSFVLTYVQKTVVWLCMYSCPKFRDMWHKVIFLAGLNSEFYFHLAANKIKAK